MDNDDEFDVPWWSVPLWLLIVVMIGRILWQAM
jgi:hypothetical protein